jgi:hypothetical protein
MAPHCGFAAPPARQSKPIVRKADSAPVAATAAGPPRPARYFQIRNYLQFGKTALTLRLA